MVSGKDGVSSLSVGDVGVKGGLSGGFSNAVS